MKMENLKEKITGFCRKFGKKNMMIAGAFVIVAVALIVAISVFGGADDKGFDYSQGSGMQDAGADQNGESEKNDSSDSIDTYFSSVELDRKRSRDEALEVLLADGKEVCQGDREDDEPEEDLVPHFYITGCAKHLHENGEKRKGCGTL